jgi:hypothetical protein
LGNSIFWGEMAPCDHMVQVYGDDAVFLDALEAFAASGLEAGEGVIVIATPLHIHGLEWRLQRRGIDLDSARAGNRYLARLADETLDRFMVAGWPDEALFGEVVRGLLATARGPENRRIRAFGEMVAVLWARGMVAATLQIESLWTALCRSENFPLFCAYPRDAFTKNPVESLAAIRSLHTKSFAAA